MKKQIMILYLICINMREWYFTIWGHSLPIHILFKRSGRFRQWKVGATKKAPLMLSSARAYQLDVRILVRVSNFGGNMMPLKLVATPVNFSAQREAKGRLWLVSSRQKWIFDRLLWCGPVSCIVMLLSFACSLTFLICHSNYQGQKKVIWSLNYLLCIWLSCRHSNKGVGLTLNLRGKRDKEGM